MKKPLMTLLALLGLGSFSVAEIRTDYVDLENFTDFSISGGSEEQAKEAFERELRRSGRLTSAVGEDRVLELTFTDIDMAGDIQPWRNRNNADIRYVESVFPPRMSFRYVLRDADGNKLASGEETIRDLAFDFRTMTSLNRHPFVYELEMLEDWARSHLPKAKS